MTPEIRFGRRSCAVVPGDFGADSVDVGTSPGGDPDSVTSGVIDADWGSARPRGIAMSSPMSVMLVGNVHLEAAGAYACLADTGASGANYGHISVVIGDTVVTEGDLTPGQTIGGTFASTTADADEPVMITYQTSAGDDAAVGMRIGWLPSGGTYGAVELNQTVTYGFDAATGCGTGSGVLADPGANSDRTSETITPTTGTPTTYHYCYGTGDQLLSSTDSSVGTIAYNTHGDTTTIHGETHTYDALDERTGTTKGTTNVTYVRDATGRIAGCASAVASGGAAFLWCTAAVFGLIGSMVWVDKEARALRRAMYAT
jgi:hypothetical protein